MLLGNSLRFRLCRRSSATLNSQLRNIHKLNNTPNNFHLYSSCSRTNLVSSFARPQRHRLSSSNGIRRGTHGITVRPKTRRGGRSDSKTLFIKRAAAVCLLERTWDAHSSPTNCEQAVAEPTTLVASTINSSSSRWKKLRHKAYRALRLFARLVKLMLAIAPVAVLYPIQRLIYTKDAGSDAHDTFLASLEDGENQTLGWYFRLCLYSVEWSGAAVIKLMQWASSRPDLFGKEFCVVFQKLQDDTTPHAMRHTEEVLRKAYGDDWMERIRLEPKVVGSGCIGQVYKGSVTNPHGEEQQVAVKVMHPNVSHAIADDLDLLRLFVKLAQVLPFDVFANMRWLNPEGVIEEFADLLQLQLDLRTEAQNLDRFNENFKDDERVAFPKLIKEFEPHPQVLIETFCEGQPVLKFLKEHSNDQKLLSEMCLVGIRAVCQMLFQDNFMHGDLHPGNVFINAKDHKFVLLDAGIATEYSNSDHELLVNILSSFIRADGRKAGRFMIDDSNMRLKSNADKAVNETLYIDKIQALTNRANSKEYFMEHLSVYLTYICEAAATHHVMMNQKFVTAALSIKVLEGISLALDPSVEIWRVANPIILKSEMNRKWSKGKEGLKNIMGDNNFIEKQR